jgi:hypothetical protein
MFKLPDFPTINFPTIDLSKFDPSNFDFPSIDFSKLDVNAIRNVKLPNVRDAAYMTVGLGVVAVERAQARREQLTAAVTERIGQVRELIRTAV